MHSPMQATRVMLSPWRYRSCKGIWRVGLVCRFECGVHTPIQPEKSDRVALQELGSRCLKARPILHRSPALFANLSDADSLDRCLASGFARSPRPGRQYRRRIVSEAALAPRLTRNGQVSL